MTENRSQSGLRTFAASHEISPEGGRPGASEHQNVPPVRRIGLGHGVTLNHYGAARWTPAWRPPAPIHQWRIAAVTAALPQHEQRHGPTFLSLPIGCSSAVSATAHDRGGPA
jgi:hypothetical protein